MNIEQWGSGSQKQFLIPGAITPSNVKLNRVDPRAQHDLVIDEPGVRGVMENNPFKRNL